MPEMDPQMQQQHGQQQISPKVSDPGEGITAMINSAINDYPVPPKKWQTTVSSEERRGFVAKM